MNAFKLAIIAVLMSHYANGQVSNPETFFRSQGQDSPVVVKWEADINGDGKNEVFLSRKDEYEQELASEQPPGWFVFVAGAAANSYTQSTGIQNHGEDALGVGVLPMIDLKQCFVGLVTELGKHALVTEQMDNPRVGDPIARIYAYTIEGDHLKRTKLAEYNATQTNALFDKYLEEGKRTVINPVEVSQ